MVRAALNSLTLTQAVVGFGLLCAVLVVILGCVPLAVMGFTACVFERVAHILHV